MDRISPNPERSRLAVRRIDLEMTQEDVARLAGISVFTISRIERGRVPAAVTAQKIARALGVLREDLWPEEEMAS